LRLGAPLLVALLSCAPAMQSTATQPIVTERLYFGRNVGDSLGVTDSAWAGFLREVVSVRLPGGFTFWTAEGEWRGSDGRPTREPSFVVEIVRSDQAIAVDSAIVTVIAEYKRRFRQESVLRVHTPGRASF
jgi:hypothetical protein